MVFALAGREYGHAIISTCKDCRSGAGPSGRVWGPFVCCHFSRGTEHMHLILQSQLAGEPQDWTKGTCGMSSFQ
jgi:hypothetical protein